KRNGVLRFEHRLGAQFRAREQEDAGILWPGVLNQPEQAGAFQEPVVPRCNGADRARRAGDVDDASNDLLVGPEALLPQAMAEKDAATSWVRQRTKLGVVAL